MRNTRKIVRSAPDPRQMRVRIDVSERDAFDQAAELSGLTLSAWVRASLREVAERRLATAGRRPSWV
jgi:uncharacterized protein (DUF1778 family)